jgi:hypothetical protein
MNNYSFGSGVYMYRNYYTATGLFNPGSGTASTNIDVVYFKDLLYMSPAALGNTVISHLIINNTTPTSFDMSSVFEDTTNGDVNCAPFSGANITNIWVPDSAVTDF